MIILPSIDIMNGSCVRLKQGDFSQQTSYSIAPSSIAKEFKNQGAQGVHVVDLQGAKRGKLAQLDIIAAIVAKFGDGVQAGGGVRTRTDIDALMAIGVQRVVLGTHIVTQQTDIPSLLSRYGVDRLVFALDVRLEDQVPYVAYSGWQADSRQTLWAILDGLPQSSHVLCTDIGRDGMETGPNFMIYQTCVKQYPHLFFQASGGISRVDDIQVLKKLGVSAGIIGKALYEEKMLLSEAIACSNDA